MERFIGGHSIVTMNFFNFGYSKMNYCFRILTLRSSVSSIFWKVILPGISWSVDKVRSLEVLTFSTVPWVLISLADKEVNIFLPENNIFTASRVHNPHFHTGYIDVWNWIQENVILWILQVIQKICMWIISCNILQNYYQILKTKINQQWNKFVI